MKREDIWDILENKVLPLVQKPGRYIGGEVNSVYKDLDKVDVRVALVFPDVYEVGMSNLGLKILYEEINSKDGFYAERVFSPWPDMEGYMRRFNIPVFSLETHSPIGEFDIIGFSLQYELCYTNVLNILDMGGIPLRSEERLNGDWPIVIAGGLMAYTPEPMAPFIDMFVIGDGEEVFVKILEIYRDVPKKEFLKEVAKRIGCVYVSVMDVPKRIKRNVFHNLDRTHLPVNPVVPFIEVVHDRANVEIMRGCPRRCRFCQAGVLYRPVRKRRIDTILDCAYRSIQNTGYTEIGLLSLSSTDFGGIDELVDSFLARWKDRRVSVSLPSMRVDSFSMSLMDRIASVKKTGITLAPEAASQKLLDVINKGYKAGDVISVAEKAYNLGYRLIKLYFMIGLPGEDFSDLDELINVLNRISRIGFGQVNVSISTMIPKPFTPFQWMEMIGLDEIRKRQEYIRNGIKRRNIRLKFHSPYLSLLEAVFGRGDRRLGDVIYRAWQLGARFDQWEECFRYELWQEAFNYCGIRMEDYLKGKDFNDPLPWDHIDIGVEKRYLQRECEDALKVLNLGYG